MSSEAEAELSTISDGGSVDGKENVNEVVADLTGKMEILKEFVSLHFRREKLAPELAELDSRTTNIQQLMSDCNDIVKNFESTVKKEYTELMEKMRKQETVMLFMVGEIMKKRSGPAQNELETPKSVIPHSGIKQRNTQSETPRLYVSEYQQSPFVSKLRPVALYFLDFEATISTQQFNEIPKYMRGRETCDELNGFLHNVIVPCFMEKYQLIHRKRDCIRNPHELEIWKLYREQVSYFPGQKFITQGDISRKLDKVVDKKMCTRIAMLRHLTILQEQRKSSTVCYIWIANSRV